VFEANKALVRRFYEQIDKGNLDAMDELVDPDYLDHNPPPFPGLSLGRDGLKRAFKCVSKIERTNEFRHQTNHIYRTLLESEVEPRQSTIHN
jgi:ketosteroid isomerase-like protein